MYDRSKYMNKSRCKTCESGNLEKDYCYMEDDKITGMVRCPLHDPDGIEELNDPKYLAHIQAMQDGS